MSYTLSKSLIGILRRLRLVLRLNKALFALTLRWSRVSESKHFLLEITSKLVRVTTFTGDTYASRWRQVRVTLIVMFAQPWRKRDASVTRRSFYQARHARVTLVSRLRHVAWAWRERDVRIDYLYFTITSRSRHADYINVTYASLIYLEDFVKCAWRQRDARASVSNVVTRS